MVELLVIQIKFRLPRLADVEDLSILGTIFMGTCGAPFSRAVLRVSRAFDAP